MMPVRDALYLDSYSHLNALDCYRLRRLVASRPNLYPLNGIQHILASDELAKDGVLSIKVGRLTEGDEELRRV